jgi:V8-like Glu-specific endopeptidase
MIKFYRLQRRSNYSSSGTGWLIREDILVTAGHCVFNQGLGLVRSIKAYIGYKGKDSLEGETSVESRHGYRVATPADWVERRSRSKDFAFVRLAGRFDNVKSIKYEDTPDTLQEELCIVGYPGDKEQNGEKGARMWVGSGIVGYEMSMESDALLKYAT